MGQLIDKLVEQPQPIIGDDANCVYERVGDFLCGAEYLLIAAGAGFGADAGLPTYVDVGTNKIYKDLDMTYADLADPNCLIERPDLFYGFWGMCMNQYRATPAHSGYDILERWVKPGGAIPHLKSHYVYTSNVDGHFRRFENLSKNMCEIHGCAEDWMCPRSMGYFRQLKFQWEERAACHRDQSNPESALRQREGERWGKWHELYPEPPSEECFGSSGRAPEDYRVRTNDQTLKFDGDMARPFNNNDKEEIIANENNESNELQAASSSQEPAPKEKQKSKDEESQTMIFPAQTEQGAVPRCKNCNELARPAVVLFNDMDASLTDKVHAAGETYQAWEVEMEKKVKNGAKLVILEFGCGTRVPSVRKECEEVLQDIMDIEGDNVRMIRVNPDHEEHQVPGVLHVRDGALKFLMQVDYVLRRRNPDYSPHPGDARSSDFGRDM